MKDIFYNEDKVNIDFGVFFGKGVFETINWQEGPILFTEHINRLKNGMKVLGIEAFNEDELIKALTMKEYKNKAVKITVTDNNIIITDRDIPYKEEDYEKGFNLNTSKVIRNSTSKLTYIKSICYYENIMEKNNSINSGYNDCLFLNEDGNITETSSANIFFVDYSNKIVTPKIQDGLLSGIIRKWVIDNFNVNEKSINMKDIENYKEAFITNSLVGIMPVNLIDNIQFNNKYIHQIREEYEEAKGKLGGNIKW